MDLRLAKELARALMKEHGLIDDKWTFEFTESKQAFGICKYRNKTIGLSRPLTLVNDVTHVRNTILHEIAHALCPGQRHNKVWQAKAIEIGCDGERFCSMEVVPPKNKYKATCGTCGCIYTANRLPKNTTSCGRCSKKFDPKYILVYLINQ